MVERRGERKGKREKEEKRKKPGRGVEETLLGDTISKNFFFFFFLIKIVQKDNQCNFF
jgi:hypothetical protein